MSYVKQNFKSREKLYASQLNAMDDQVEANAKGIRSLGSGDHFAIFPEWNKGYLKSDGTIFTEEAYKTSELIHIPAGYALVFNSFASSGTYYWCNYNSEGVFADTGVKGINSRYGIKIDAIEDRYVKICTNTLHIDVDQSAPYIISLSEDPTTFSEISNVCEATGVQFVSGYLSASTHARVDSEAYHCTNVIYLQKGQTIEFKCCGSSSAVLLMDIDRDYSYKSSLVVGDGKYHRLTYTADHDMFVRICSRTSSGGNYVTLDDFKDVKFYYKSLYHKKEKLNDKEVIVIGDSLIYGNTLGNGVTWTEMLSNNTGAIVYNYGINGNAISGVSGATGTPMSVRYADIEEITTADIIVIEGGANDKNQNCPIGDIGDNANTTFIGACNVLIDGIRELNPKAKLLFMTTYNRYASKNSLGLSEKDYADAMMIACANKSVPCYNNYSESGISFIDSNLKTWVDEGVYLGSSSNQHFSPAGYEFLYPKYKCFIEEGAGRGFVDFSEILSNLMEDLKDHEGRIYRIEQEIGQMDMQNLNFEQMIENISTGNGKNFYPVGDQILMNYNYNGVDYECPYNILDHGSDVILDENGNEVEVPSMSVEWEYTIPNGLAFDPQEAMYVAPESGLPAGTYHFKVDGDSWNSENGKTFQFTLTEPLTEGMHLRPTKNYNDLFANTNMCVYADGKSTTALQTVNISEGNEGSDLGTMGSGDLNHYHRIFLGYNRWSQSLCRQWLNSEGTGWWTPQNKFDRAPSGVDTLVGYLSNIPEELKAVLKPVKLQTYRNNVTDDGGIDVTYDKVFLLSFANWNNESNSSIQSPGDGVEGDAYEYYRRIAEGVENLNAKGNFRIWQTYPILIRYALNAKTSAQYVFSRSANRSSGSYVLSVHPSGYVTSSIASNGVRCRPACKICGNLPSHASAE